MDRPDLYVVARFLDALYRAEQPMKKTGIQMQVGLNYTRFTEYLDWLLVHGLVQRAGDSETELYALSPKGLDSYHTLVDWIRKTIHETRP